ncbi:MAG TPA: hypothetical protein VHX86_11090 [Tepidisphaeraceae bacterium]|jgi:hypothetical protein|nr:hypothetical protein [Tepidisphaeraceae bacterium]
MTDTHQLQQDLHYVREVVSNADRGRRRPVAIYWLWALYVLIGYPLKDFAPRYSGLFFLMGWPVCFVATVYLAHRFKKTLGVRPIRDRSKLFWLGGALLILFCVAAMSAAIPALRGQFIGQVAVVIVGIFYFLGGVHYDRSFLWLGPLLCVCGLLVGFVPHYGWTALGIVFALGLIVPTLFTPRPPELSAETTPG